MNILTGVLLTVCAAEDFCSRKISVQWPVVALIIGVVLRVSEGTLLSWNCGIGVLVGGIFLALAVVSRQQFGIGDALILTACGLCVGGERLISLVFCAMVLFLLVGVAKVVCGKLESSKKIPFVPFLWAVFMLSLSLYS